MLVKVKAVNGRLGRVKTDCSEDELPLDPEFAALLHQWKSRCRKTPGDWVFPSHMAIDLGGTHATCAVVRDRSILAAKTVAADRESNLESLLPVLRDALIESLAKLSLDASACSALVFGFPGIVSTRENRVLSTNAKFADAPDLDLRA